MTALARHRASGAPTTPRRARLGPSGESAAGRQGHAPAALPRRGRRGPGPRVASRPLQPAVLGAAVAAGAHRLLAAAPLDGESWLSPNARGRTVSLRSGPALALAVASTCDLPRTAAAVAALGAAAIGRYDDRVGARSPAKGLRGHLAALAAGRLTSGTVKLAGLAAVGFGSAALLDRPDRGLPTLLVDGAVVAGSANLVNLLDLRPGRALKAGTATALLLRQPGPAGAASALLPADLHERAMLGDCGANAFGAVLGLALVRAHPAHRVRALIALTLLTALSEVVSFSRIIDAVPGLRWVDRAGRLT